MILGVYGQPISRIDSLFSLQGKFPSKEGNIHLEIQKILYKKGKWDLFFGGNLYRSIKLKGLSPEILNHLQMLEAMALSRHCLNQQALEILSGINSGNNLEDAKSLRDYISLNADLSFIEENTDDTLRIKKSAISKKSFWTMNSKRIMRLKSQKGLRVNLKSRCKS